MIDAPILDEILADVSAGIPTHKAVESRGINRRKFYEHLSKDEDLANRYTRAKVAGCRAWADETHEIQDEEPPKVQTADGGVRVDSGWVQWQKNRVENRRWHLAKLLPQLYGDKTQMEHSGGIKVLRLDDADADLL